MAKWNYLVSTIIFTILILVSNTVYGSIPSIEREALIALYNSTDGDNWTDNSGWKTPPLDSDGFAMPGTEDSWYGVHILNDRMNFITMGDNQLSGSIPTQLGDLSNLTELYLYGNELTCSIPSELGNLSNLTVLSLSTNGLSGSIPSELGNLSNLTELALSKNELSGSIPTQLVDLSNLTEIYLNENELTGSIPFELGNLSNLTVLYLWGNELTGSIPFELGNLSNLTRLSLAENQLTGSIPSELGNLSNLTRLNLTKNQLTGSIPFELGNLSNLTFLSLSKNELSGSIPTQLGDLSNLTELYLYGNELTGSIPSELGGLSNLTHLFLWGNELTGSIPSELGNLSNLTMLTIRDNQLSGSIPSELGNLTNLTVLWLRYNQLSGSIPSSLLNLISFEDNYGVSICGNSLYTDSDEIRNFLNQKEFDVDWESCQNNEGDPPSIATLISPLDSISDTTLTFTWNAVSNSTWYQLWVNDSTGTPIKEWYTSEEVGCESGTCSTTSNKTLESGSCSWWIQTWNDNGNGDWSDEMNFTISSSGSSSIPSAATLVSPDSSASNSVTYTWNAVSGSTWYRLWVDDSNGNKIKKWYSAAQANCESGFTCSVTNSTTITGSSTWWVQTYNDNGNGEWSSGMSFTVCGEDTPSAITITSPSGNISDSTPIYTWNAVSGSTWYQLWVDDSTGTAINKWYTSAQAGCESGTGDCSITPTETLESGSCNWWVRGWNNDGNGDWSAGMSFTVSD